MDLPTPDDTPRAEDHADAGGRDRPAGARMRLDRQPILEIVAILYLLLRISHLSFIMLYVTILFGAASWYLLRYLLCPSLRRVSVGWPRFFALGCLSNLAVLFGAFLCGCLFGSHGFGFGGVGGGGGPVGGRGDAPTGIEGGLNALGLFSVAFFFMPFVPLFFWAGGVAAYKADQNRGLGMDEGPGTLARVLFLRVAAILLLIQVSSVSSFDFWQLHNLFDLGILAAAVISYLAYRMLSGDTERVDDFETPA
jgi:hypothetical protein